MAGAHKIGMKAVDEAVKNKNSMALNKMAWDIVDPEGNIKNKDLELGAEGRRRGREAHQQQGWHLILDTLARSLLGEGRQGQGH